MFRSPPERLDIPFEIFKLGFEPAHPRLQNGAIAKDRFGSESMFDLPGNLLTFYDISRKAHYTFLGRVPNLGDRQRSIIKAQRLRIVLPLELQYTL